jgi:predicted TIM-barrel fold metal-dependent hydrolase
VAEATVRSPSPSPGSRRPAALRVVDADLHHELPPWSAIAPFVPAGLRHRVARPGGPPLAQHGFRSVGAPAPPAASDPRVVKEQYLDPRGVDRAVLTGGVLSLGVQPNADLAAALARGINDWTLETWVRPFDCYRASILIAPQDAALAVAEIDRLGDDPGVVQVLMGSASDRPFGNRAFHPIYEACVRHGLPLALHVGGEGAGLSPPATAAGHPTTYFEWEGALPQSYMAHVLSMVCEGVFARFPTLRVVLYESGVFWLPHLMWRFDKNWKAQRSETPWVTEPPSTYIGEHFYLTTYPLEAAPDPAYLERLVEMAPFDRRLLFSSNYPRWTYGDPFEMLEGVPERVRAPAMADNALALYGPRLLASGREG